MKGLILHTCHNKMNYDKNILEIPLKHEKNIIIVIKQLTDIVHYNSIFQNLQCIHLYLSYNNFKFYQKNEHKKIKITGWCKSYIKYFTIVHDKVKKLNLTKSEYKKLGCVPGCKFNSCTFFFIFSFLDEK